MNWSKLDECWTGDASQRVSELVDRIIESMFPSRVM